MANHQWPADRKQTLKQTDWGIRKWQENLVLRLQSAYVTTTEQMGQHQEVIPNHRPIKPGTLHGILKSIASHHKMTIEELINAFKL
jgi:hypothetical protein